MPLTYHDLIVSELLVDDALVILGRGLGTSTALARYIIRTTTSNSVTLAINVSRSITHSVIFPSILSQLRHESSSSHTNTDNKKDALLFVPRFVGADYSAKERAEVYQKGGFLVVTAQVLTHDLLLGNLDAKKVGCLCVWAAERLKQGSSEHFAIKLLREGSRQAKVKAFSENPTAFARGFHTAEKVLRLLGLKRLSLFPRFHAEVQKELAKCPPELIDLSIGVGGNVALIIEALRDAAKSTIDELRLCAKSIDLSEVFTKDRKTLVSNFANVVNRQMNEGAADKKAEFSQRARKLASDLTALHEVIRDALALNSVAFYQRCVTLSHTDPTRSGWLIRRDAQRALAIARSRVYVRKKKNILRNSISRGRSGEERSTKLAKINGTKVKGRSEKQNEDEDETEIIPVLEPSVKWSILQEVLKEAEDAKARTVLVVAREKNTVTELRRVLTRGSKDHLMRQFSHVFRSLYDRCEQQKQGRSSNGPVPSSNQATSIIVPLEDEIDHDALKLDEVDDYFGELGASTMSVIIWGLDRVDGEGRMRRMLGELCPEVVVMYDYDMCFIRQVEVYKAENSGVPLRLYLLLYDDESDESLVHTSGEREKGAFKALIRHRATMVIHVDEEEDTEQAKQKRPGAENSGYEDIAGDQRAGPGQRFQGADWDMQLSRSLSKNSRQRSIVLDTRELRGSIPMALFARGIKIVPVTLEVGDFILTPRTAVERKTVPDLYGSFASGRLFNQAEALSRHYANPCLLIEFESEKKLSLLATESYTKTSSELQINSIIAKVVILIRRFPALRLLWARGAREAADLFEAIKGHEEEPNAEEAAKHGVDSSEDADEVYNAGPRAFLRNLPGIDGKNIFSVMKKVKNVAELLKMDQAQMIKTLGSQKNGSLLYEFVNENPAEAIGAL